MIKIKILEPYLFSHLSIRLQRPQFYNRNYRTVNVIKKPKVIPLSGLISSQFTWRCWIHRFLFVVGFSWSLSPRSVKKVMLTPYWISEGRLRDRRRRSCGNWLRRRYGRWLRMTSCQRGWNRRWRIPQTWNLKKTKFQKWKQVFIVKSVISKYYYYF